MGTLLVEVVLSGLSGAQALLTVAQGGRDARSVVAALSLGTLALAALAGLGVAHSFRTRGRELDRQAQVLAAAASTSADWLWETDLGGRLTYSSSGISDLLGFAPDEVLGRLSNDLLYDDSQRELATRLLDGSRATDGGWSSVQVAWRHRSGDPVALRGTAVPLHDHKARTIGYRGTRTLVAVGVGTSARCAASRRVDALLASGSFEMALQPLVCLTSGRVTGVEALARFHDGRGPDEWFRDAADGGRTLALEERTFRAALRLMDEVPAEVYLSINASPALLLDPRFRASLTSGGVPLHRLVIEITEHARVADYDDLNAALATLREQGARFAIDDTGAGYASLSHVLRLRPDVIKLDRALITHLEDDRARRSLVTALVLLAIDIGATVTGEGTETMAQVDTLATLGVDQAQGYAIARPTTDRSQWASWWHRAS